MDQQERIDAAGIVLAEYYKEAAARPLDREDPILKDAAYMARFEQAQEIAFDTALQRPDLAAVAYAVCKIIGIENPNTGNRVLMMAVIHAISKAARSGPGLSPPLLFQLLGISTTSSSPE